MPWPPGEADAPPQLVAVRPEDTRQFQDRRVTHGIVSAANAPGVQMAMRQHKLLRLLAATNLGHEQWHDLPAQIRQRMNSEIQSAGRSQCH
jgi:hypothetical protein